MYEIGCVYVWQNLVGRFSHYNGKETIVLEGPTRQLKVDGTGYGYGCKTDTEFAPGRFAHAAAGKLRPKNPPSGEQKIRSMFEPKPLMEVA
jgi:hypothetical protein